MGSKKKTGRHRVQKMASNSSVPARKDHTIKECFSRKLFGLPALHFAYVKKVSPGLPLFLFNYSDRKVHGIFEAAGHGQLNIDPHAWTGGSVEYTQYPAQAQFNIYKRCHALTEDQFSPIIADNYYEARLFWFELGRFQTAKLIELFSSSSVPYDGLHPRNIPTSEASTSVPQSNAHVPFEQNAWSSQFNDDSTSDMVKKVENLKIVSSHPTSPLSKQSNEEWKSQTSHLINKSGELHKVCAEEWAEASTSLPQGNAHIPFEQKTWSSLFKGDSTSDMVNKVENLKIVSSRPTSPLSKQSNEEWKSWTSHLINKSVELHKVCAKERAEGDNTQPLLETNGRSVGGDSSVDQRYIPPEFSDILSTVSKLMQNVTMLMERQTKQEEKIRTLEKELVQSRDAFQKLQNRYNVLQAGPLPSSQQFEGVDYILNH